MTLKPSHTIACLLAALPISMQLPGQTIAASAGRQHTSSTSAPSGDPLFNLQPKEEATQAIHLTVGRAMVLTTKAPLKRVYIGEPSVLESFSSGPQELVLTAKSSGRSSFVLWDTSGRSYVYTVYADIDAKASLDALHASFPQSAIKVEGREGKLFLTGTVPTEAASDAAFKLASAYSHEVVNTLQVTPVHGKQVELKLRIVEIDRTKAEQFGVNFLTGGRTSSSVTTQQFGTNTVSSSGGVSITDPLNLFLYNYKLNFGLTLKDLESRQILQILAEPTLTTMSGVPARFLSGGEFPVPVAQGGVGNSTAVTIQYRPYGVKVDFTPTVNQDGTIHLKVSPEVSALDYSNSVTISGTTVPSLSTRKADTEVELLDGESFVVSGLFDRRTTNNLGNVPGASNLPLVGQLFRSKNLNHSVVELVVLVTATVVDPLAHPQTPTEPKLVVPELDTHTFDKTVRGILKVTDPAATPSGQSQAPSLPATSTTAAAAATPSAIEVCTVAQTDTAQIVLTSLARRGYNARAEHSPSDPLIHVCIGPFPSRDDAVAMQEKLANDGFNAQLKDSSRKEL